MHTPIQERYVQMGRRRKMCIRDSLVSASVESMYGLDKALKAADVKIAELSEIPSRVNTGGAIVYGTESACRSAVEAFAEGVEYCAFHPMDIE